MKYEYICKENLDIEEINELGKQGWELCAVRGSDVSGFAINELFYFKKTLQNK